MRRFGRPREPLAHQQYCASTMARDPDHPYDERAAGLAMLGTIFFCTVVGGGVGIFFEQPVIGSIGGAVAGILIGLWLVPRLLQDWI